MYVIRKIGIVGPCAAGKSTLITGLKKRGVEARHIAQEHSYVADMWKRITNPDILIYLHVSYPQTVKRRNLSWTEEEYQIQLHRLRHAREHAHLLIDTDLVSPDEVLQRVLEYLEKQ